MENVYQMEGYTLHLIPTKKFKTMTISLRLQSPLLKDTTTIRTLLTFVLMAATQDYPSTQSLATYLDENYGASLSTHITTKGQSHIINVATSFVNDAYLPSPEHLLEKQLQLISELFYHPYLDNDGFHPSIVQLKKKELQEKLQANKDDKFSYSLDKLFEYMGRGQVLGIPSTGYEEEIQNITSQQLYQYLQKCIKEDEKHVYVVGDLPDDIVNVFERILKFPSHCHDYPSAYIFESPRQDLLEVIEKQDITQSKLNLGYQIQCDFTSPSHYAFTVFNAIFGGFSQSRLFKVVREKHSLCYYVSSSYDAFNGMMIVNAGIEANDYRKTLHLIGEQLADIQAGHVNNDELYLAKIMLVNALKKTNDEAGSMIALAYNRDITHIRETSEEYIEKLMNVTLEEIVDVAKKVKLDTIYFLTGKEFHESH